MDAVSREAAEELMAARHKPLHILQMRKLSHTDQVVQRYSERQGRLGDRI